MALINGLLAFVFLGCLIAFVIGLIKPSIFKIKGQPLNRKQTSIYSMVAAIVSLVLFTATMSDEQKAEQKAQQAVAVAEQKAETQKKEQQVAPQPLQPEKIEVGLGMTPDEFRQKLNDEIIQADAGSVKPLKKIEVTDNSFQINNISNIDMTLVGQTNKNGEIKSLVYIFGAVQNQEDLAIVMLYPGLTAKILSPEIATKEKTSKVIELMTKAAEGIKNEKNNHSEIIGGVKYWVTASPQMGFWVGFEPK